MYRWAVIITVVTMANLLGNVLITAAALGQLTMAYPGVASATDLDKTVQPMRQMLADLQRGQKEEKIRGITNDLLTARGKVCLAEKTNNPSAKEYAEVQFSDLYTQFQRMTGIAWRVPDCSEVN